MLKIGTDVLKSLSKGHVETFFLSSAATSTVLRPTRSAVAPKPRSLAQVYKRQISSSPKSSVKAVSSPGTILETKRASTTATVITPSNDLTPPLSIKGDLQHGDDDGLDYATAQSDLFQLSLSPQKAMPLSTQLALVKIGRVSPQGFFIARDRNLAMMTEQQETKKRGSQGVSVPPPLSARDKQLLEKKAKSKTRDVPLEIDPEYQKLVAPSYKSNLMPLEGQYNASQMALEEMRTFKEAFGDLFLDQLDLETQAVNLETLRYQSSKDNVTDLNRGSEMGPARTLVRKWYPSLLATIKDKLAGGNTGIRPSVAKVLLHLRAETLAAITLHTTIGQTLAHPDGTSFSALATAIAETVQAQLNYERLKSFDPTFLERKYGPKAVFSQRSIQNLARTRLQQPEHPEGLEEEQELLRQQQQGAFTTSALEDTPLNRLSQADTDVHGHFTSGTDAFTGKKRYATPKELGAPEAAHWTKDLKQYVGKDLLNCLVEVATFTHVTENGVKHEKQAFELEVPKSAATSEKQSKQIRLAEPIMENISYEHVLQEANHIRHYPMLTRPRPWKGPEDGGYFLYPASLLRYYDYEQQIRPLYENQDQLSLLYESLSVLGETPWKINNQVYNVVKQAWSEGGAVADIPSRHDLPIPVPGAEGKTPQWYRQLQRIQRENYNKNSLRCDLLLKLQVAEKFSDEHAIYFPHNMDFRGRVYPIPPHLNHMGADLCRGLLTFAEGMPLGPRGLYWLKIQLANLYGQDKIPFEQRIAWAEEHLPEVADSALRPLRGNRWWLKAEDPWQCLACCFELHKAVNHPDGPENYVCSLPIHQDGTCNGLQHYAALGGDEQGAKSVNLLPADRPQDVYADVASLVQARIAQDASNGVEIANMLKGQVNRRIIKQTVMTSVYGVTFVGARQQIANALKDRGVLDEDSRYQASVYLAKATFDSIGEMFTGARNIMDWFATCASLIAKRNRLVNWTTPLGLPVSQPYKKMAKKNVLKTAFQTITLENEANGPVNSLRQRSAFPPNFVHSLDSSHMLLTALACKRKGIVFSSVHDSYWSHACNVDQMNVELRECFVELHRRPLLQRLYDQFCKDNPDITFPPVPERGSFDLDLVKQSPYFFN